MDDDLRRVLRLAVGRCRQELERDYLRQLEGTFGITADGRSAPEAQVRHLDARGRDDRRAIIAALEHLRAAGFAPDGAVEQFVRESAFSTLNRLTALKLMEAPERRLVAESIGNGATSSGARQFGLLSPEAMRAEPDGGYRLHLETLCEDLSIEIGVLFDLRLGQGRLFPSEPALRTVLDELNAPALAAVWSEDETLGWVYQYFTPKEQRDAARKASAAPRNAYELAFRNQFYTPRYVVAFLVDNALGRIWYEMRQGDTRLAEQCRSMVRKPHPIWLKPSGPAPQPIPARSGWDWLNWDWESESRFWLPPNPDIDDEATLWAYALSTGWEAAERYGGIPQLGQFANRMAQTYAETGAWNGTFEELRCCLFFEQRRWRHFGTSPEGEDWTRLLALNRAICAAWEREVEVVAHREKRDPRELRVLDPACGSGHFLLYAFDLLLTIYAEAWDDPELGPALRAEFADDLTAWQRETPRLILQHNLHGIDIDLRAVQIAQLALWLRAQRAWAAQGIRVADRPRVEQVHVVCAEPLPGDRTLLAEFVKDLQPLVLADLVEAVWEGMAGVGEIGSLLKADHLLQRIVADARREWQSGEVFDQITLFEPEARPARQQRLDLTFISDESFWDGAAGQVLEQLQTYAAVVRDGDALTAYRRRLFAGDAAAGFALLELFLRPFDVVLMNPPFGAVSHGARAYVERHYPRTKNDLYAAFVERGLEVLRPGGRLGAITSRTGFFLTSFRTWREEILLKEAQPIVVADLGYGVLDTAMVETAAYVLEKR